MYGKSKSPSSNNSCSQVRINTRDKEAIPKIQIKLDIKTKKTLFPPSTNIFNKLNDKQFLATIIGVIDGDGSIHKHSGSGYIYGGINWYKVFDNWCHRLKKIYKLDKDITITEKKPIGVGKQTTLCINIPQYVISQLKLFAIDSKLPILDRKWILAKNNVRSFDHTLQKIKELYNKNLTVKEIAKQLNLDPRTIHYHLKSKGIRDGK